MPGSFEVLAQIAALSEDALQRPVALADGTRARIQFVSYDFCGASSRSSSEPVAQDRL